MHYWIETTSGDWLNSEWIRTLYVQEFADTFEVIADIGEREVLISEHDTVFEANRDLRKLLDSFQKG